MVGAEPLVRADRVFGIDTGAVHGLRLTGLVLPERRLVSVPSRGDHWESVSRRWQVPRLRARPWSTMTFSQLHKKVGELRRPEALDADRYLDGVVAWARAIEGELPMLAAEVDARVAKLVAEHGDEGFGPAASAVGVVLTPEPHPPDEPGT